MVQRAFFLRAVLLCQWCIYPVATLPSGFIEEIVGSIGSAVSGTFAPNPKDSHGGAPPMLLLASKTGIVTVMKTPDTSDESTVILDLRENICENGERGLQSVVVHPNFTENNLVYLFYTKFRDGCLEGADAGPWNVVTRFRMNPDTLELTYDTREEIWRSPSLLNPNHIGGGMAFGNDGMLYVTTGDSGDTETAQPLNNSFGSVIRLTEDGDVPDDNPFTQQNGYENAYRCADTEGYVPAGAPDGAVCSEVFAYGFRNPFRITMDPSVEEKVRFTIQDVGGAHWEEISVGGTDYAGRNYEWPLSEGVCRKGSLEDCPVSDNLNHQEPIHYYAHRSTEEGGCITGATFVPEGIWPSKYKFLFIDYIFLEIYNLIETPDMECRTCLPPVPGYQNETFYTSIQDPDEHVNEARMTDLFFGPYNDTQALYVVRRGNFDTVVRIRYTGILNQPPLAIFTMDGRNYAIGEEVAFDAGSSSDPEGDDVTFEWDFGDGVTSTKQNTSHSYESKGQYRVTLVVTDSEGQAQQASETVIVGQPPVATILSPADEDRFYVGQVLRLHGEAFDSNGNAIPDDRLNWEVRQHHADHFHPFFGPTNGATFDLSPAPEPEDFWAATNSFLKIVFYATDDDGLTTEVQRDVLPTSVIVDVDSKPPGLAVTIDEYLVETPQKITSWVGFHLPLLAQDRAPFVFKHWIVENGTATDIIVNGDATWEILPSMVELSVMAVFCLEDAAGLNCTGAASDCCQGTCVDGACTNETDPPTDPVEVAVTVPPGAEGVETGNEVPEDVESCQGCSNNSDATSETAVAEGGDSSGARTSLFEMVSFGVVCSVFLLASH